MPPQTHLLIAILLLVFQNPQTFEVTAFRTRGLQTLRKYDISTQTTRRHFNKPSSPEGDSPRVDFLIFSFILDLNQLNHVISHENPPSVLLPESERVAEMEMSKITSNTKF